MLIPVRNSSDLFSKKRNFSIEVFLKNFMFIKKRIIMNIKHLYEKMYQVQIKFFGVTENPIKNFL